MKRLDDNQLRIVMALSLAGGNKEKAKQAELILKDREAIDEQGD